jgi:hypothetical protein
VRAVQMQTLQKCLRARRMYVPYQRDALIFREIVEPHLHHNGNDGHTFAAAHEQEEAEIQKYQENLPLSVLVAFHQDAAREAALQVIKLRGDENLMKQYVDAHMPPRGEGKGHRSTKKPSDVAKDSTDSDAKKKGWLGWLTGKSKSPAKPSTPPAAVQALSQYSTEALENQSHRLTADEAAEDERMLADLESTLNKYSAEAEASANDVFTLRLAVNTSLVLSVLLRKQPVAFFDMSMHTKVEVRNTGTKLIFEVDKLAIEDNISVKPIHKFLLLSMEDKHQALENDDTVEDAVNMPRIDDLGGLASPVHYDRPRFSMYFHTSEGQSHVKVQAAPVQLVLNEPCIRGLVTVFSTEASAYTQDAPLLALSMNTISTRFSVPEDSSLTVEVEAYAPTIIIPEKYDADRGCLQMDTGKLLMKGRLTPQEQNVDVIVNAVNMSMPRSGIVDKGTISRNTSQKVRSNSVEHDELYLVKPFDVQVRVRMAPDTEAADTVIGLDINPGIEGQVDAQKLIRLKYIADGAMRAIEPLPTDVGAEQTKFSGRGSGWRQAQSAVKRGEKSRSRERSSDQSQDDKFGFKKGGTFARDIYDADSPKKQPPVVPEDHHNSYEAFIAARQPDLDYKRVTVNLCVRLPRLAMALWIAEDHNAELSISDVGLTVIQRAGDMSVQVLAQSLALTDSLRPEEHRAILWTHSGEQGSSRENANDEPPLLKVALRQIMSPLSPLYNGNQTELYLVMSTLHCGIDDVSTMSYAPFAKTLVDQFMSYDSAQGDKKDGSGDKDKEKEKGKGSDQDKDKDKEVAETDDVLEIARQQAPAGPVKVPFGGTEMIISISAISLDILQDLGGSQSRRKYERAFSTEVRDIFAQYTAAGAVNEAVAHIGAVEVKDVRPSSADFVYNIICTRNVESQVVTDSEASTPTSHHDSTEADVIPHPDKIISLRFTQNLDELLTTVEVYLQDLTSYVSLDIIMAFAELLIANANAFQAIMGTIATDDITVLVAKRMQQLQASSAENSLATLSKHIIHDSMTNLNEIKENMNLTVVVINPRLLLLENPTIRSTKAIVSDCAITLHYSQEKLTAIKTKSVHVSETIHVALQRAQVFVLSNLAESNNPHKIVAPTGLDIVVKLQSENGVQISTSVNVGSEPIACRVSLNDMVLTNAIIARAQLVQAKPPREEDVEDLEAAEQKKASYQPQQIMMLMLQCNFATISVVLLNDYHDANKPMFRAVIDHLSFHSAGAVDRMEGEGSMLFSADYYNDAIALWEPVMEPWMPSVTLTRGEMGTEITLDGAGILQVNLSGAMFNGIYTCLALVQRIGKEGMATERPKEHPLVVRNYLGTPLELFDSRTGESLAVLMDDEPFDVPAKGTSVRHRKQGSYRKVEFPDMFELRVLDEHVGERAPITQLPARALHTRVYHFLPANAGPTGPTAATSKPLHSEPITEEVYENQRYYPHRFAWGDPWAELSDPSKWTDSAGKEVPDPSRITLPPNWQWVDKGWKVDVGIIGRETDSDGWFYNNVFSSFTASRSGRRSQQALDVVRRRRWVRTRAPKRVEVAPTAQQEAVMSIPVFWAVKHKSNECTEIHITSGLEFHNDSPCELDVQMLEASGKPVIERMLSVEKGGVLRMPYTVVGASFFRVRPTGKDYSWSDKLPCKLKIDETTPKLQTVEKALCRKDNEDNVNLVLYVQQNDKHIVLTCTGCAIVHNRLPCPLSVLVGQRGGGADTNLLAPGEDFSVIRVAVDAQTEVNLAIGEFTSVNPVRVGGLKYNKETTVWLRHQDQVKGGEAEPDLLGITLKPTLNDAGVVEFNIYSQYMLQDQSDLAMQVNINTKDLPAPASSYAKHPTDMVVRRTFQHEQRFARKPIIEQIQQLENISAAACWAEGMGGVTLFQAGKENSISLGVNGGGGVKADVSLDALSGEKAPMEIVDPTSEMAYNVAVTLTALPGPLACTRLLKVMPAYTIVNNMDEAIEFLHPTDRNSARNFTVPPRSGRAWHRPTAHPGTEVRLRTESTASSLSCVDLNDIGAYLLVLPCKAGDQDHSNHVVAHVEVKFSDADESSYISVVIWKADVKRLPNHYVDNSTSMMSIRNDTDFLVSVLQDGANDVAGGEPPAVLRRCELVLKPGEWQPYGWIDANLGNNLAVAISDPKTNNRVTAVVNMLLVGQPQVLGGAVTLVVRMVGNGKVLHVKNTYKAAASLADEMLNEVPASPTPGGLMVDRSNDLVVKLRCQSIGLSIVAEKPTRRELIGVYIEEVETHVRMAQDASAMMSIDLQVKDIQVDNYMDVGLYPVLATSIYSDERLTQKKKHRRPGRRSRTRSKDKGKDNKGSQDSADPTANDDEFGGDSDYSPFLRFGVMWEQPRGHSGIVVKYLALRMLELKVSLDTTTILIYFLDLHRDVVQQTGVYIDVNDPNGVQHFFEEFNEQVLDTQLYHINAQDVKSDEAVKRAQGYKYFFEALIIHPIKISATFSPTHLPSERVEQADRELGDNNKIRLVPRIAAVEDFPLKVNSFIVDHAMESIKSMGQRIGTKILHDLKKGMVHIAGNLVGSMALLGKPAGLYKNIGGGVSDFFYEVSCPSVLWAVIFGAGFGKNTVNSPCA